MQMSRSSYYAWLERPAKLITAEELQLYPRAKALFKRSRQSLGYRELCKNLRKEGFQITFYKTRKLMAQLNLVVKEEDTQTIIRVSHDNKLIMEELNKRIKGGGGEFILDNSSNEIVSYSLSKILIR